MTIHETFLGVIAIMKDYEKESHYCMCFHDKIVDNIGSFHFGCMVVGISDVSCVCLLLMVKILLSPN